VSTLPVSCGLTSGGADLQSLFPLSYPSFLLTFALAELEESRKDFPKAHALFSGLLGRLQPTLEKTKASIVDEIAAAVASVADVVAPTKTTGNHLITDPSQRRSKAEEVRVRRERETDELEKGVALAWIMYMRFARRAEVRPTWVCLIVCSLADDFCCALSYLAGHQGCSIDLPKGAQVCASCVAGVRGCCGDRVPLLKGAERRDPHL
jgi:hypothetical protein